MCVYICGRKGRWREKGGGGPGKGKIQSKDSEGRSDDLVVIDFLNLHEQGILGIAKTYCA